MMQNTWKLDYLEVRYAKKPYVLWAKPWLR